MRSFITILFASFLFISVLPVSALASSATDTPIDVVPDAVEFALLKKFYDSLGGSGWTTKTNWPTPGNWPASATSAQFGTWFGITVVNGDISKILLNNRHLVGKIPSDIGNLQALTVLSLYSNGAVTGKIPGSLGSISTLTDVYLYNCALSGSIPGSVFNLTGLKVFNVSDNNLSGVIPSNIGNAAALTYLSLGTNDLTGSIPVSICSLANVQTLILGDNQLSGEIPATIGSMASLQSLQLNTNALTGPIPTGIGDLSDLTILYLHGNMLSGAIPSSLGNLQNLQSLYLLSNQLTGIIPTALSTLDNLLILRLDDNLLSGSIPPELGNMSLLEQLYLSQNQLTGSIPASLGNLQHLISLILNNNLLTGNLPAELGDISTLKNLYVQSNQLSGAIPASLGDLSQLLILYFSSNQFTGTLPPSLGNLTNLTHFYVNGNKLTGELPTALGSLTKLKYLYLNDNAFTGGIPSTFSAFTQMIGFYAYNNKLIGTLPSNLFSGWSTLTTVSLNNNKFSGPFPSLASCTVFTTLGAASNLFTTYPPGTLSLPVLTTVNMGTNEITTVPSLASQVNKTKLTVTVINNRLDFSSLEGLKTAGLKATALSPQKNIADITEVTAVVQQPLVIPARDPGVNSTITWEQLQADGVTWSSVNASNQDATQHTYTRNAYATSDEGTYRWKMTNTVVPGVTIQCDPIKARAALSALLDNWTFQYKYDGRKRLTHKKVPGADWVYMVYDDRDRVVLVQNGEQRKTNQWTFTKYDALNRQIMSGLYTHTGFISQEDMSNQISTSNLFDTYDGSSTFYGYTNTVFPYDAAKLEVLTVTYYDSYTFKSLLADSRYDYKADEFTEQYTYDANNTSFPFVTGQVTGIRTKVLGKGNLLTAINYYDDRYRVVQTAATDMEGNLDRTTQVYDFVGKVLKSKTSRTEYSVKWTNVAGPAVLDTKINQLRKLGGSDAWIAGATSEQVLPAGTNGWVECTVTETGKNRAIGLSVANSNPDLASMNYAIVLLASSFPVRVYQSGLQVKQLAGLRVGDVVRVERTGTVISFRINGTLITGAAVPASTTDLVVDASLFSSSAALTDARASFAARTSSIIRFFDYDDAGRLMEIRHQVNDEPMVLLAENKYNELGQLITKKLHSTDEGTTSKQAVDYRYNIRGWMTRINNSALTPDDINDPRDHFGMNLTYNDPVPTLSNTLQYNGNISAITWSNNQGYGDVKENAYRYGYDAMNRIADAGFRQKHASTWGPPEHKDENDDTQTSEAFSENGYDYDLNGNLQHLTRKGTKGLGMDVLTYNYGTGAGQSNKLLSVTDAGDITQGFADGNKVGDDYLYDVNGSMVADKNKDIAAITYNHLNLPMQVMKANGEFVRYFYDAMGRKLCQQVFDASSVLQKQSEYAGEFFYENDTLKFINHEEGRIVMTGTAPEYQYNLKDHLGNVRVTFTAKEETETAMATMETANATAENGKFLYYNEAVIVNFDLFDHTNAGPTYYSTRLNGLPNEQTGLAKSLSVMPGDMVNAKVYAKYLDIEPGNWEQNVVDFVDDLLMGTAAPGTVIDGEAIGSTGGVPAPFGSLLDKSNETGDAPKAYLNYLVFDRNYKVLDGGFIRITDAAIEDGTDGDHEELAKDLEIKEAGYVYLWLSNDNVALGGSAVEVYFDDFEVEHVKSPVIQLDDYYPFGLTYNSYKRENSLLNRKRFQSQEHIDDLSLNWDSFKWRNHQPEIGRFFNVDPLAEKYYYYSPYAFSGNQVVSHIELEGLEPVEFQEIIPEPEGPSPSIGALLNEAGDVFNTLIDFFFGDGNDGTPESAAKVGNAMNKVQPLQEESQKLKERVEGTLGQIPGLNVAFNVMDASQAETTGETMEHLGKAALNANSIPVAGGPRSSNMGKGANKLRSDPKATGSHTSFKTGTNGKVYKYETYEKTESGYFNPVKRYDGGKPDGSPGAPHVNKITKEAVPTPHVQGKRIPGGVRPAFPMEIPQ